jgi:hypothetical protein
MRLKTLKITGPGQAAYALGAPLLVFDDEQHLGTVDPVPVSADGTEVHIEHFVPTDIGKERSLGSLILVELAAFLVENCTTVQVISFALGRDIEGYHDANKLASVRSALLHSIGAAQVLITPRPDLLHAGHFIVAGIWEYNQANIKALYAALHTERAIFGMSDAAEAGSEPRGPIAWLKRLLPRGAR